MNALRSERGIVVDWLLKIAIGLALLGVVGFDAGSILVNYFTLDTAAGDVAVAVSTSVPAHLARDFTDEEVFDLAQAVVANPEEGVKGARVLREGTLVEDDGTVRIRLRRVADTLIVGRIGAIKHWARATSNGQSRTP